MSKKNPKIVIILDEVSIHTIYSNCTLFENDRLELQIDNGFGFISNIPLEMIISIQIGQTNIKFETSQDKILFYNAISMKFAEYR